MLKAYHLGDTETHPHFLIKHASPLHAWMQVLAFEAMKADSRVAIDIAALNAVVDAYARCGRMPEAETCLHEATQRRQQRGLHPLLV